MTILADNQEKTELNLSMFIPSKWGKIGYINCPQFFMFFSDNSSYLIFCLSIYKFMCKLFEFIVKISLSLIYRLSSSLICFPMPYRLVSKLLRLTYLSYPTLLATSQLASLPNWYSKTLNFMFPYIPFLTGKKSCGVSVNIVLMMLLALLFALSWWITDNK